MAAIATVFDVAAYILQRQGRMTAMKLQKLVYYAQAWSLVWDERPLYDEPLQAWANGPVVPDLYQWHRGAFEILECPRGNAVALDATARETIDAVLGFYGKMTAQQLSDLTHQEEPWLQARRGIGQGQRGNRTISVAAVHEYYSGLLADAEAG